LEKKEKRKRIRGGVMRTFVHQTFEGKRNHERREGKLKEGGWNSYQSTTEKITKGEFV